MDLIQEFGIQGERKGERLLAFLHQSIIHDIRELVEDEDLRMNRLRLSLLGYEVEGEMGRMN
jgi:hypothetical protein